MQFQRLLGSLVARGVASRTWRELRQLPSAVEHRVRGGRRVLEFFHQVDDPHSHLAVQCLAGLRSAYAIDLVIHLVRPPALTENPSPETYRNWARRDAADVAPHYGLKFEDPGAQPPADQVSKARAILSAALDRASLPELATAVGQALWSGDSAGLDEIAARHGADTDSIAQAREELGEARRRRLGHYAAGMFHFGGEWYWGVDRLLHLEARLAALGAAVGANPPVMPRPSLQSPRSRRDAARIRVECFASVRSPYTAIVLRRVVEWADATGVQLELRPVLPMVMRGVPLSRAKGFYILADTTREADRAGVRFGRLTDPIGEPAERALALWPWAESRGCGSRYLLSCVEGAWADGIDLGSDRGLARVVERCNLSWVEARRELRKRDWREIIEGNRQALYDTELWGVPSFRVTGPDPAAGTWHCWGQDRFWRLTREVARRADGEG
ncbi:MAG: 2-hydroxychromene-2-carboxylate isomerase [Gammaproteobacteria bacterium]|nr:MAG: 2-hydroxychromene-2-carboxylate isomerase [Gammaproteobacteria bacterium]